MKYIFILYDYGTASMNMRGIAVSESLRKAGIDARCVTNDQLNDVKFDKDTIATIIKVPQESTINHLRRHNAKIVFDIIDKFNWESLLKLDFDCVIAANQVHQNKISNYFKKQIVIIPHLHTNAARKQKTISTINTVGYIGQSIQFPISSDMQKYCHKRGIKWFQAGGDKAKTVEEETLNLDLGVVYIDKSIERHGLDYESVANYKPATKLTNMFSYGIPALFSPTASFMEAIAPDPVLQFLVVNSVDEIYKKVDQLRADNDLYHDLSKRCLIIAENYHIDHASKYYGRLK